MRSDIIFIDITSLVKEVRMKRFLSYIILLSLVLFSLSGCQGNSDSSDDTHAPSEVLKETETPAQNFQYTVNEDNTVFINKYTGSDKHVVIPSQIDGMPVSLLLGVPDKEYSYLATEGVFENTGVESVIIPDTVVKIGGRAFMGCKSLSSVSLSNASSLQTIGASAFKGCNKLESLDASATKLKLIEAQAFEGCSALKNVILPETATTIKANAFCDCTSLLEINLPDTLTDIEGFAFKNCTSLKKLTIPKSLRMNGFEGPAFYGNTSLETIIFEDGREEIAGYIFFEIDQSVDIVIPASVKKFSCLPFNVINKTPKTPIKITFMGDCPEITDTHEYFGDPTVLYNPNTNGWSECEWQGMYKFEEMK